METIYLLLGSNQGNRLENLIQAKTWIGEIGKVTSSSSIYQTKAWGNEDQDDFLNQALSIKSTENPDELLKHLKEIEIRMGRAVGEKWEPRIIDIDILFYGIKKIQSLNLVIPHPHIKERRFALTPLAEIAAGFIHPAFRQSVKELLEQCPDTLGVEKYFKLN